MFLFPFPISLTARAVKLNADATVINCVPLMIQIHLKKNKAFRRFKKLQEGRPEFHNHTLEDLLQLPIKRIDQ